MEPLIPVLGVRARGPRTGVVRAAACAALAAGLALGVGAPGAGASGASGDSGAAAAAGSVTGSVERLHLDVFSSAPGAPDPVLTFVHTAGGRVKVPTSVLDGVHDGATVRLGLRSDRGLHLGGGGAQSLPQDAADARDPQTGADVASVEVLSADSATAVDSAAGTAVAGTTAAHDVTVVAATWSGGPAVSASSATSVAAVVSGGVNDYWSTVSHGEVTFSGTAYPSVVTAAYAPCSAGDVSGSWNFWSDVAGKAGFVAGPGKHLLVYFGNTSACGGSAGLGTVGSGITSGGQLWSNGYSTVGVIAHELGHNLGLGHSQLLDCTSGSRVSDADVGSCTKHTYWDFSDVMGISWQHQGWLNAVHQQQLGLLDASAVVAPTSNTTVTLAPMASDAGTRVLQLVDGGTTYLLEYHAAVGLESWLGTADGWDDVGVTVHKVLDRTTLTATQASTFPAYESLQLDGDPMTSDANPGSGYRVVLPVGYAVPLAAGRLHVEVLSTSAAGADVAVQVGSTPMVLPPGYTPPVVKPVLSTPRSALVAGSVRTSGGRVLVPTRWAWTVRTPTALSSASAAGSLSSPTSYAINRYTATARASDGTLVTSTGAAYSKYVGEKASSMRYRGTWKSVSAGSTIGGTVRRTTTRGASMTTTVSARGVAVIAPKASSRGVMAVYVDGHLVAKVSMYSRTTTGSQVVWSRTWSTSAKHTVKLVNLWSGTRHTMTYDGIAAML